MRRILDRLVSSHLILVRVMGSGLAKPDALVIFVSGLAPNAGGEEHSLETLSKIMAASDGNKFLGQESTILNYVYSHFSG